MDAREPSRQGAVRVERGAQFFQAGQGLARPLNAPPSRRREAAGQSRQPLGLHLDRPQ